MLTVAAACRSGEERQGGTTAVVDTLPSPAARGGSEPNLFAAADGRVYLSWVEPAGDSSHALRFATLEGDRWSAPRTITRRSDIWLNWADFPSVIALPNGRLAAHWPQRSGAGTYDYDVRIAQSADSGATWSGGVVPHRGGAKGEHGFVSLFPVGDSVGAIWLDGRQFDTTRAGATKEMALAYTTLAADGSLGAERLIDRRICDCCQTAMAVTARGPVVVFRDRSPDEVRDIGIVRRVNGAWTEPALVHADGWRVDYCPVNGPAVSARGDRVAVAWFTVAQDTPRVRVAFSDDAGATFGAPARVDDGQPAGRVDVELDDAGGALVSWVERVGGERAEIRVRHVRADGSRGPAMTVAASTAARASGFPQMARSGNRVVFAWTAPGDPSQVRVARLTLPEGR